MITLVRAVQTSIACPSQWDAWDAEGRYYYLRFRHGYGTVEAAPTKELWRANCVELPVSEERPYGGYSWPGTDFLSECDFEDEEADGSITLEGFCEKAGLALAPDVERTAWGRHIMNELTKELRHDPAALARADQLMAGVDLDKE